MWVLVLEAAKDDPLRAQEIYDSLSEIWWKRWLINRDSKIKAQKKEAQRNKKRGGKR